MCISPARTPVRKSNSPSQAVGQFYRNNILPFKPHLALTKKMVVASPELPNGISDNLTATGGFSRLSTLQDDAPFPPRTTTGPRHGGGAAALPRPRRGAQVPSGFSHAPGAAGGAPACQPCPGPALTHRSSPSARISFLPLVSPRSAPGSAPSPPGDLPSPRPPPNSSRPAAPLRGRAPEPSLRSTPAPFPCALTSRSREWLCGRGRRQRCGGQVRCWLGVAPRTVRPARPRPR